MIYILLSHFDLSINFILCLLLQPNFFFVMTVSIFQTFLLQTFKYFLALIIQPNF